MEQLKKRNSLTFGTQVRQSWWSPTTSYIAKRFYTIYLMPAFGEREITAYFEVNSRYPRHCLGAWKFVLDIVLRSVLVGPSWGRTRWHSVKICLDSAHWPSRYACTPVPNFARYLKNCKCLQFKFYAKFDMKAHSTVVVGGNKSQKVPFLGSEGRIGYGFTS